MRKYGGQESVNLSQFGSDRGDRGPFLYQFSLSSLILCISVSAPVMQNE